MTPLPQYIYFICPWTEWGTVHRNDTQLVIRRHLPSFVTYDYKQACKLYTYLNEKYSLQRRAGMKDIPKHKACMFFKDEY
uniref:Uncharacterized protein n=1 Tax=Marseillevirus LCMAC102 TaxID=2506603 RepID=A0A481YT90_9VIRU|nr:MAG: hypothetical protein LCMAC102_00940 [Marseillevirus LCMAC102]